MVPENFNLGYACINTELRKKNIFMSRTCRLATLKSKGLDYVKSLCIKNIKDIQKILEWNVENKIFLFRLSSEIFPFASHLEHGYPIDFAKDLLKTVGDYAKQHGIRITMHPGQYCVLSSPTEKIIQNTSRDLQLHAQILDYMGMDEQSIMVIHGGGVYKNKKLALQRLEKNINELPENVKSRLVLENCEMSYTVEELLPISEKLNVPIIIDMHHDDINPGSKKIEEYFDRVFSVWQKRNIKPKVHVSNSCEGVTDKDSKTKRRKHGDYVLFFHDALLKIKFPIDVMIEAKLKEQAILKLRSL